MSLSLSREINGVSPATLPHSLYLTQAGYWKFISRDMNFISDQSRVHSFAYFFLHCSVWVKWLFNRYSRHFSTYIGVQTHGKSFALNFINIWQLLYLDFLLFRIGILDTAPGHSTIPDRTSYQPQATSVCRRFRIYRQRSRGQDGLPLCQTVRSPSVYVDYVAFFLS